MKPVKNVLLITKEFQCKFQENIGGTGVFYKNLASEFVKKGINVYVFGSSKKPFQFSEKNLEVHFVKDYFKKSKLTELLRSVSGKISVIKNFHLKLYDREAEYLAKELQKFISKKNIDVIETHDWEGLGRIAEDLKIPYVIRCHGSWSVLKNFFGYGAAAGKIYGEKKAFGKAENIITISKSSEKMVQKLFGPKNCHLIYNGIDTDFYQPSPTSGKIDKSVFFIGNVSTEKGAETALKAFIKVYEKQHAATLHFIGKETELLNELRKKISENQISEKVFFYGRKDKDEAKRLLSQAEVVIFPSKGETFGLALIESMALEKPVITSDIDAFKEIVSDGTDGFTAVSAEDFSERILEIFGNKNLALQLSENARKTVLEKFSLKNMVEETLDYYQKIIP
ncbi:hypothetical protein ASG31_15090 [Chryseobacterium sp. Leaf404]|uniref:glycosyltransferase family 4 protein n=1 Tax=unclassified Chryseobacterium TaxID=2593645 RepID=UPI0006FC9EDC|nr:MULTISPECIES: glycosyltransferase family 4 protein [unclassified Chryseobacterium]KQT15254.1 hypothetical protein ASG31_15090 [Chryseobacterium sp. Leaf404]